MKYSASEKLEIIQLVAASALPVRRTLEKIGIPRATFYRWYDLYRAGGPEALDDRHPKPDRVWNRIPDDVRERIIRLALDEEGLVIGALQSRLMDPALLAEFCNEYTRHLNRLRSEIFASLGGARTELGKLAKQRENFIQAIKDGVPAIEVKDDLARIAARREDLEALLAETKEEPVLLHPNMAEHYRKQVA